MARSYFARGCRGDVVCDIQNGLDERGYYTGRIDGLYGGGTAAITALQQARSLPVSGSVDEATWYASMGTALPTLVQRCLGLTAAFEGHGYPIVVGNFDGAWLTWVIIGFTVKHGEVQKIILEAWERGPDVVTNAFGDKTKELIDRFRRNDPAELQSWADAISVDAMCTTLSDRAPCNPGQSPSASRSATADH